MTQDDEFEKWWNEHQSIQMNPLMPLAEKAFRAGFEAGKREAKFEIAIEEQRGYKQWTEAPF